MQLGWLASNGIIGEVVADARGFYAEEGIELREAGIDRAILDRIDCIQVLALHLRQIQCFQSPDGIEKFLMIILIDLLQGFVTQHLVLSGMALHVGNNIQ